MAACRHLCEVQAMICIIETAKISLICLQIPRFKFELLFFCQETCLFDDKKEGVEQLIKQALAKVGPAQREAVITDLSQVGDWFIW